MSVLDIGCNAGFYSFELAKLGANVTAIDTNDHYLSQARWAAKKLDLKKNITIEKMQLYDLTNLQEDFDIIFFLGVFYHLRYPLLGLDIVVSKTKKFLIFQTLTLPGEENPKETPYDVDYEKREMLNENYWPRMAFVENRLAGDPTNWWVPNIACVEAMLRSSGLKIKNKILNEFYICEPDGKSSLPPGHFLKPNV
jgi:tRNA (mo5U34)-methyltransferase